MNIASITVTITDNTQVGRTLLDLFQNGTGGGYTVVGTKLGNVGWTNVGYRSVQYVSGGSLYLGDPGTKTDGTCQGITMATSGLTLWARDDFGSRISLGLYARASANSTIFNVLIEGE